MRFHSTHLAFALSVILASVTPAAAQDVASFYKGKTVRIVVGFTPGGGYDVYARAWRAITAATFPAIPRWWCRTCRARRA